MPSKIGHLTHLEIDDFEASCRCHTKFGLQERKTAALCRYVEFLQHPRRQKSQPLPCAALTATRQRTLNTLKGSFELFNSFRNGVGCFLPLID